MRSNPVNYWDIYGLESKPGTSNSTYSPGKPGKLGIGSVFTASGTSSFIGSVAGGVVGGGLGVPFGGVTAGFSGFIGGQIGGLIGGLFDKPSGGCLNYGENKAVEAANSKAWREATPAEVIEGLGYTNYYDMPAGTESDDHISLEEWLSQSDDDDNTTSLGENNSSSGTSNSSSSASKTGNDSGWTTSEGGWLGL